MESAIQFNITYYIVILYYNYEHLPEHLYEHLRENLYEHLCEILYEQALHESVRWSPCNVLVKGVRKGVRKGFRKGFVKVLGKVFVIAIYYNNIVYYKI